MKQTFLTMLIAGTLIIVGLSACTKDSVTPVATTVTSQATRTTLHLVADQWVNRGSGVYINDFRNILSKGNRVSVYMEDNDELTMLSMSPIMFKGHELWAETTATDVILNYSCADQPIPFRTMNIKVVVD